MPYQAPPPKGALPEQCSPEPQVGQQRSPVRGRRSGGAQSRGRCTLSPPGVIISPPSSCLGAECRQFQGEERPMSMEKSQTTETALTCRGSEVGLQQGSYLSWLASLGRSGATSESAGHQGTSQDVPRGFLPLLSLLWPPLTSSGLQLHPWLQGPAFQAECQGTRSDDQMEHAKLGPLPHIWDMWPPQHTASDSFPIVCSLGKCAQ